MSAKRRLFGKRARKGKDAEVDETTETDEISETDEALDETAATTEGSEIVDAIDVADDEAETEVVDEVGSDENEPASLPRRPRFGIGRRRSDVPVVGAGLLRPFDLAPKKETVQKEPTIGVARLALVGAVIAAVAGVGYLYVTSTDARDAAAAERADLTEILERPAPPTPGAIRSEAEGALLTDQITRTDAIAGILVERVAWDRVLNSVSRVAPEGTWFTSMAGTPPEVSEDAPPPPAAEDAEGDAGSVPAPPPEPELSEISLSGFAEDHEQIAVLLGRLDALRDLENVTLATSGATLIGETEVVQFAVTADVTPGRTS